MSEMIEQVAKAICETVFGPFDTAELDHPSSISAQSVLAARAAIEAMRKPTENMLERGDHGTSAFGWSCMIDEALK